MTEKEMTWHAGVTWMDNVLEMSFKIDGISYIMDVEKGA